MSYSDPWTLAKYYLEKAQELWRESRFTNDESERQRLESEAASYDRNAEEQQRAYGDYSSVSSSDSDDS